MSNVNATKAEIVAAAEAFKMDMETSVSIEHSGVKGMKWGVWNDETKRKYGLGVKTKAKFAGGVDAAKATLKKAAEKLNAKATAKRAERATAKAAKAQQRAELKAQRKELGMSKKEFDKLRDQTLKSHDPKVVAKGMHTLTDDELKAKINRLYEEDKISSMATKREKERHNVNAARNEALNKNPIVQVGKTAAVQFTNKTINELGYNTLVMKGIKPPLEQRVTYAANKAQREFANTHPGSEPKVVWKQSGKPGTYNSKQITSAGAKAGPYFRSKTPGQQVARNNPKPKRSTVRDFKPVTKYKPSKSNVDAGRKKLTGQDLSSLNNLKRLS